MLNNILQLFKRNPLTNEVEPSFEDFSMPQGARLYWKMDPPLRLGISEHNGIASEVKRMSGYGPAPRLEPVTRRDTNTTSEDFPSVHINVRDEHHWTESPQSSRREVPTLSLKEMRIMTNPMLNQMFNNIMSTVEAGADFVSKAQSVYNKISDASSFDFASASKEINESGDKSSDQDGNTQPTNSGGQGPVLENVGRGSALLSESKQYADPMNPYSLLYTTMATGFKYSMPYMEDTYITNSSMFGEDPTNSSGKLVQMVGDLAEIGREFMQTLNMRKMTSPGRLVEQPKAFTFTGREKSYTVSFPLLNTKSYTEVIKNWQFLFLLAYQNTPNRINRDLIDPPCIYEAYIPGLWYSKYAALTNLSVNFVGARREMFVPIQFLDHADNEHAQTATGNWIPKNKKCLAVIPDAYQVTMTFTELFGETQNFKHQMLRESINQQITVGTLRS